MTELVISDLVLDLVLYLLFARDALVVVSIIGSCAVGSLAIVIALDNEDEKHFNSLAQGVMELTRAVAQQRWRVRRKPSQNVSAASVVVIEFVEFQDVVQGCVEVVELSRRRW